MRPGEPKPILFAEGQIDIRFTCEKCGAQTTRSMSADARDGGASPAA